VAETINEALADLRGKSADELIDERYAKFRAMGKVG